MTLLVKQVTGYSNDWTLKDFVRNCGEDIKLDIAPDSVEVNKIFSDGVGTVLFAYKIGCVGGIDPVIVKYFAFKNGVKYSLREKSILLSVVRASVGRRLQYLISISGMTNLF